MIGVDRGWWRQKFIKVNVFLFFDLIQHARFYGRRCVRVSDVINVIKRIIKITLTVTCHNFLKPKSCSTSRSEFELSVVLDRS